MRNYKVNRFSELWRDSTMHDNTPDGAAISTLLLLDINHEYLLAAEDELAEIETQLFEIETAIQEEVACNKELTSDVKRKAALNHLKATNASWVSAKNLHCRLLKDVKTISFTIDQLKRFYRLQEALVSSAKSEVV